MHEINDYKLEQKSWNWIFPRFGMLLMNLHVTGVTKLSFVIQSQFWREEEEKPHWTNVFLHIYSWAIQQIDLCSVGRINWSEWRKGRTNKKQESVHQMNIYFLSTSIDIMTEWMNRGWRQVSIQYKLMWSLSIQSFRILINYTKLMTYQFHAQQFQLEINLWTFRNCVTWYLWQTTRYNKV